MKVLLPLMDVRREGSWANRIRRRRLRLLMRLLSNIDRPLRILDIGGTPQFWETSRLLDRDPGLEITVVNIVPQETQHPQIRCLQADARALHSIQDQQFQIVFSNSVIEHLGELMDMGRMADEIRRVGRRYFVQTPNRHFLIEPHFHFPCFQLLPVRMRVWLVRRFSLGWFSRAQNSAEAEAIVRSIRLLSRRELQKLFPDARLVREKFLGFTKSFIVYRA